MGKGLLNNVQKNITFPPRWLPLYISGVVCAVKNIMDLQCLYWKGLYPVHALVSTKIFYRRVNIQKAFHQCGKAHESSRRWFWFNICHKFFNVCAIRALTQQMLS